MVALISFVDQKVYKRIVFRHNLGLNKPFVK